MLSKILIGIVLIIGLIAAYAAVQPAEYVIARSISIKAPASEIFPWINNSKKMNEWMPWIELDPKVVMTYSGPDEGVGAKSSWTSEGQMGVGSATISESTPNELVKTRLEYTKPFEMVQEAQMSITEKDGASVVRWSVSGKNNFIGRFFCVFMNMDKMVGNSFEKGLSKLKTTLEK